MDSETLVKIISILFVFFQILRPFCSKSFSKLPPGPKQLPIFGNIFELSDMPHHSFANLAKIYGPLMSLKLGSVTTIVVSSSNVAKEMFHGCDEILSSKTIPDSVRASKHDKFSMSWLPVSMKWQNLKKISTIHLLSTQRLDASEALRQAKVKQLLEYVQECSKKGLPVDIGRATFTTSLNFLSSTLFSKELVHHKSNASQEFKKLIRCILEDIGRPNYVDFFPILRYVDLFGIRSRLTTYFDKLIAVFQDIIRERINSRLTNSSNTNDFLDKLLNLYQKNELTMDDINHLLLDFFNAGTDTFASTIEWAMAELMKNPKVMREVQTEIEQAICKDCAVIQESDISKLPYLQAVIKETLRLHPPLALLPRKAETNIELHGYVVPKNAQVLVNLWAIGRDPKVWDNPEMFSPQRFLNSDIDFKGKNFELLPFGTGRRICPGMTLANRMLNLMMASLLNSFDWKLSDDMSTKDLDMSEKFGITLQKVVPLQVIPIPKKFPE